ncbi:MAG: DUF6504 family protein [Actinomycetota bacterium]|nr:DUF6504 family protein [Actinomycetota bacterium]
MRRYDDPVAVVRGRVADIEAPAQFMWRGRLWRVFAVVSTWVETGPWWEREGEAGTQCGEVSAAGLLAEREVWRVEAARGRRGARAVVDLSFDWARGEWRLVRCLD